MTAKGRRITRSVLLEGAAELLDEGEYKSLTVDALSKHLRMSKSTMYKYFIGKDDVVTALMDDICSKTEAALDDVDCADSGVRCLESIAEVFSAHADRLPRACILTPTRMPRKAHQRVKKTKKALTAAVAKAIALGTKTGEFNFPHAEVAATSFTAACFEVMQMSAETGRPRGAAVSDVMSLMGPGLERPA